MTGFQKPAPTLTTWLPGPDRKRTPSAYQYKLIYRNPDERAAGCVMLWAVVGGRESYQVALEGDERGKLHWHCTCADAVYRGETLFGHRCKHVTGLLDFAPPE